MPELPDITIYIECLTTRVQNRALEEVRIRSPFLLRTVDPKPAAAVGRRVRELRRIGKRIVFEFEDELFFVFHLMIAGRFRWKKRGSGVPGKAGLAAFDFETGTLIMTEASNRKRASLHVVRGEQPLAGFDPGGLEPLEADVEAFAARLRSENHTLKRALTDPRLFSGIGNAYSDEILHRARLSPMKLTARLSGDEIVRLHEAVVETLTRWTDRLRRQVGDGFPDKVTAFHEGMTVHGRHKKPCPDCGAPVQRIRYADRECNYCARCQNQGRVLADRSLSRLLKDDWPRRIEDLEQKQERRVSGTPPLTQKPHLR